MADPIDSRTRNGSLMLQGDQYIRSNLPSDPDKDRDNDTSASGDTDKDMAGLYGQNGYTGASSDLPGQNTTTGFLPQCKLPADYQGLDWQTRKVDANPYKTTHGMHKPGAVKMDTKVSRPVVKR